jgi:hypothetical protein
LLERRPLAKRKLWRELKLVILTSLAKLSSREAQRALERTAESRDQQLRVRAQRLLVSSNSVRDRPATGSAASAVTARTSEPVQPPGRGEPSDTAAPPAPVAGRDPADAAESARADEPLH